jgi:hypothetical protein
MATTSGEDFDDSYTPPGSPTLDIPAPESGDYPTKFDPREPEKLYKPELPFCSDEFIPYECYKEAVKHLNRLNKQQSYAVTINNLSRGRGLNKNKIYTVFLRCSHSGI